MTVDGTDWHLFQPGRVTHWEGPAGQDRKGRPTGSFRMVGGSLPDTTGHASPSLPILPRPFHGVEERMEFGYPGVPETGGEAGVALRKLPHQMLPFESYLARRDTEPHLIILDEDLRSVENVSTAIGFIGDG